MSWLEGLTGHIITPREAEYEKARQNFNSRFSKFPKAIVYCTSAQDVINAVRWVRKHKMPFRVRGGGHSYEAFSLVDDGLIIDVSRLLHLKIDKIHGKARVGAGFRILPLYESLWKQGVTVPSGTCPTIGLSGLTLGGGHGYLSRLFGLTCDNLLEVELINPWGRIIKANKENANDLFWACRGGGDGSFGVITSFVFRIHPIGDIAHYSMAWDFADLHNVVRFWQKWAPNVDNRLTSMLLLNAAKQGDILSRGLFVGLEKELRRLLRPMLQEVPPKTVTIRSASWITAARMFAGAVTHQAKFNNSSSFVYEPISNEAISVLNQQLSGAPGPRNFVMFDAMGGAISRFLPEETAFVHRNALFMMQYLSYWENDADESKNIEWVEQFRRSMLPFTRGAYRDYCDRLIPDWPSAYFGDNFIKLKKVKRVYDPENFFRFEQSIPL